MKRLVFFGLLSLGLLPVHLPLRTAPPSEPKPARALTASEFAALSERLSEPEGYFWNDNFVSNEASYLHPLRKLDELGIHGGIYLGVGPNQNFTYIAHVKPRYAFVLDIRRQNLLEHLLFKALFHFARNRREYLSLLLSRPLTGEGAPGSGSGIVELVSYFNRVEPDAPLYRRTRSRIRSFLQGALRVKLSAKDLAAIDRIHTAFFLRGLSIKYDFIPVPTFGEFLVEKDLDGRCGNFLNDDADFFYLKRMQSENRIIPLVADFAGTHALRELGRYLRDQGEKVILFYTSNVEQYLLRNQSWPQFVANVRELPLDEKAVFVRAYWSPYIPHPDGVEGYLFTQVLQWMRPFLDRFQPERTYSYWEIVTTDTIKLR